MTYPEALFFTSKCLTLGLYPERIQEVRAKIRSGSVVWEQLVWVSTGQFVFAALYLQLQRAGLLPELPEDLVEYMEEFTTKNRERNKQIIEEALEITALLNNNNIFPVFLKGTAHLLEGLYEDIGERMVGDIDILVEEMAMESAGELLLKMGFKITEKYDPKNIGRIKHFPRLRNDNFPAAVEIHRQILDYPECKTIEGKILIQHRQKLDLDCNAFVLSDEHQIIHNILHLQISDLGYYYATYSLRQSYDLLQLSQKANPLNVIQDFGKFFHPMNGYLALTNLIMGNPKCLPYTNNWQVNLFLGRAKRHIRYPYQGRISHAILYLCHRFFNQALVLISLLYNGNARKSFYARLSDPKWYGAHIRSYKANI